MQTRRGWTFPDFLALCAALVVLYAIVAPRFRNVITRSGVTKAKTHLRAMSAALDFYYLDYAAYPPSVGSPERTRIPEEIYRGDRPMASPPLNSHRLALIGLTSPTPYLESVAFDAPFLSRAWEISEGEGRGESRSYWYINYNDFYRTARGCVAPKPLNGYGLLAFGPRSEGIGGVSAPYADYRPTADKVPCLNRPNVNQVYDPTNGAVSKGNILTFGGDLGLEEGVMYFPVEME